MSRYDDNDIPTGLIAAGCAGLLLLGLAILGFSSYQTVPAGGVGVQTTFGAIHDKTLPPGFHFINPMTSVTIFTTQIQKHDAEYSAASKDMQAVHVKMIINYSLDGSKAMTVYQTIGEKYENKIIDPAANEVLKAVLANHPASDILHNRSKIKGDVQTTLQTWLEKYGIKLAEVALSEISFDPAYTHAIEQKQVQEQLAQQKIYELERTQREADIAKAKAKGEADSVIAKATGDAEALKLRGESEASYNEQVSKSLSPVLLRQLFIKTWDGHYPKFLNGGGTGGNFLFTLNEEATEKADSK